MRIDCKHIVIFFYTAFVFSLAVSCGKSGPAGEGVPIEFGVSNVDVSVKSVLDQETVNEGSVYVYADEGGASLYSGEAITLETGTGKWLPEKIETWENGVGYTFYGYTSSYSGSSVLTVSDEGRVIEVSQPASYSPDDMADYLLSYIFNVSDGAVRPVVNLSLEHAMSLVEIKVVRSPSIFDARLNSLAIKGFYRSAKMQCQQAVYGSGDTNEWTVTLSGDPDTGYSIPNGADIPSSEDETNDGIMMRFMAIPQQLTSGVTLTVEYSVNEKSTADDEDNYQVHTEEFRLYNFSPSEWRSGHRVVYVLTVDTGIHLYGMIAPWKNVDNIEGTVLPEI